ncbi:MAG: hypothetical protein ACRDSL_10760 [Pseudonocardiaceae bacterium]
MTARGRPATRTPGAGLVVLAGHRPIQAGGPDPVAHLVPPPGGQGETTVRALCGARLPADEIEAVTAGQSIWCTSCFLAQVTGQRPTSGTLAGRRAAAAAYRRLGWPVLLRHNQITLDLDLDTDAVALVLPAPLAAEVITILFQRRCRPPVLAHPALPTHRIILAAERYPVALGWPAGVRRGQRHRAAAPHPHPPGAGGLGAPPAAPGAAADPRVRRIRRPAHRAAQPPRGQATTPGRAATHELGRGHPHLAGQGWPQGCGWPNHWGGWQRLATLRHRVGGS